MKLHILTILSALLVAFSSAEGQQKSLDDLNREKAKLQSIIEQNSKLMQEYSDRRNNEMMKISVVDSKISKRKSLISVYESEILAYEQQVRILQHKIDSVQTEVDRQKDEYADMLRQIQSHGTGYSPLAYILSSQSFNQSYRRFLFIRQLSDYRREQFAKLSASMETLARLKERASMHLSSVQSLKVQVITENKELNKELKARQANVKDINNSQQDLKSQIAKAQEQTRQLELQIVAIIKEEAERAKREAEEARKRAEAERKAAADAKRGNKGSNASNPPAESTKSEAEILSEDILANKGKLPWPVRSFVITSQFGEHDHPLIPQIKIRNNGVDVDVLASKEVHPIHKGVVSRVIIIPGSSASIIIRHGNVLSVYSNLATVNVKKDQQVDLSTNLGSVFSGEGINSNILHFELWQGDQKQNPENWLRKQ